MTLATDVSQLRSAPTERDFDSIARIKRQIEARLAQATPPDDEPPEVLHTAMRYALLAPGKRLRALLCVLTARCAGHRGGAPLLAGCAVEMVHTASLILDDLPCMDDARLRRGQPAVHVRYGESGAILAAIGLLTRAFGMLGEIGDVTPTTRAALVTELARASGSLGLSAGQALDLAGPRAVARPDDADRLNDLKTGSLFTAAVLMGARLAETTARDRAELRRFAEAYGRAFQLADDLTDRLGDAALSGKDVGKDAGKPTMVALVGVEETRRRLGQQWRAAATALDRCGFDTLPLQRLVELSRRHLEPAPAEGAA